MKPIAEIDCVGCKNKGKPICQECQADGSSKDYYVPTLKQRIETWLLIRGLKKAEKQEAKRNGKRA